MFKDPKVMVNRSTEQDKVNLEGLDIEGQENNESCNIPLQIVNLGGEFSFDDNEALPH